MYQPKLGYMLHIQNHIDYSQEEYLFLLLKKKSETRKNKKYQKAGSSLLVGFFECLLERDLLSPFLRTGDFFAEFLADELPRTDTEKGIGTIARVRFKLLMVGAGGGICSSRSR